MNAITKRSARLIALLKKDIVQHLSFAAFVFVIIFCCLAIFAWYQGKAEHLPLARIEPKLTKAA